MGPGGHALAVALVAAALAGAAPGAARGVLGAQEPARRDSTVRADSLRRAAADSAARDSVVRPQPTDTTIRRPTIFDLLQLDRLHLVALGAAAGGAWPAQAVPTEVWSLHADYGEIARKVRLVFVVSYWGTRYDDEAVRGYEQSIRDAVIDPSGDDTVRVGRVSVSDVSLGAEVRWAPFQRRPFTRGLRPWIGAGAAANVVNVEGKGLDDSFVEGALDQIALGLAAVAGVDLALLPNIQLTMLARYDMFSGIRHATARAGFSYIFDPGEAR